MRIRQRLAPLLVAGMALLGGTGCIKSMILNGTIQGTRQGSSAVDTLQDYEVAKAIAFAGLGQMEGMHRLAPSNEDALFMLTKSWGGATFAFIEDEMETFEDLGQRDMAEYEKTRAIAGYDRALSYGLELLSHTDGGFQEARRNDSTIRAWLKKNFTSKDDAPNLLWTGYAWLSKTNAAKDDPDVVADLFIGVAIIERSVELDETYNYATGLTILAAYHARTALSELDQSEQLFQRAFAITQNKSLVQKFTYATKLQCARADFAGYKKTLQDILDAGDILPEQRLTNVIAKRKARRYLGKARLESMRDDCGFQELELARTRDFLLNR